MNTNNGVLAPVIPKEGLKQTAIVVGELVKQFKAENGQQGPAGLYTTGSDQLGVDRFELTEGSDPSFNNNTDLDRLLFTMTHTANALRNYTHAGLYAIAVKHGNPCGAGFGKPGEEKRILRDTLAGDPLAVFGGTLMTNFDIVEEHIPLFFNEKKKVLFDGIIAPDFRTTAIEALKRREGKCRFLKNAALGREYLPMDGTPLIRQVRGGFMLQENYFNIPELRTPSEDVQKYGELTADQHRDMLFGWAICATSNSNTITLVKDRKLIGNGVGQQARIYAAEIAVGRARKHGHDIEGAVAVSDSYFAFNDAVEYLIHAGVKAILSTSGSNNDEKVIALCKEHGVTLYMMPDSNHRMFFRH